MERAKLMKMDYVDIEMELILEPGDAELIVSGYNCLASFIRCYGCSSRTIIYIY